MPKKADEPNTDGKGGAKVPVAGEEAPGTQAGGEGEGTKDAATLAAEKVVADAAAKKATEDAEAAKKNEGKVFTQADVDRIVTDRLEREKKKKAGEFEALYTESSAELETTKTKLSELEEEAKAEREVIKAQLQTEIDELPEEVKAMAPDMKVKGGLAKVREWLPTAKTLAGKLETAAKVPGNAPDPKALGGAGGAEAATDITARAAKHSIYKRF